MLHIERPTAVINPVIVRRNIARMTAKARASGVAFRPHFKTHQSAEIGAWFQAEGVTAITVSSVDMAAYFAAHGWRDITIAFPVNWLQIETINRLAGQINLGLLVESPETVQFLQQKLNAPVKVWLKIDAGARRTGIRWDDTTTLDTVGTVLKLADKLKLAGLLVYSGQTGTVIGSRSIQTIYRDTLERLKSVRERLQQRGLTDHIAFSVGDTPTCSRLEEFREVDEIRPGNFVFYDMQQVSLNSCTVQDVGLAVACPVVAKHPGRGIITLYGGAVHLSKDYDDGWLHGAVALPTETGWSMPLAGTRVIQLSQEHGLVETTAEVLARVNVGDVLMVLPVHACLCADLLKGYRTPDGAPLTMMRL